jgi:hypothetical protein
LLVNESEGHSHFVSRRAMLGGGAAALLATVIGPEWFFASAANASTAPANAAAAATLAKSFTNYTRAQLTPIFDDAPWSGYGAANPWCAWFASWFMRAAAGVGYQTFASGLYATGTPVTSPVVGDICYYPGDGHVGMVVEVVGSVARVVEGNAGDAPGIVKYRPNGPYSSNHQFSRPAWPSQPSNNAGGYPDMLLLRLGTTVVSGVPSTFALFGPGYWYEFSESQPWPMANGILAQIGSGGPIGTTQAQWNDIKAAAQATQKVQVVP